MAAHLLSIKDQIQNDPQDFREARRFIVSYLPRIVQSTEAYVALAERDDLHVLARRRRLAAARGALLGRLGRGRVHADEQRVVDERVAREERAVALDRRDERPLAARPPRELEPAPLAEPVEVLERRAAPLGALARARRAAERRSLEVVPHVDRERAREEVVHHEQPLDARRRAARGPAEVRAERELEQQEVARHERERGVLADVLTAGAGTALTGELLTDAAAIGAVALGGAAAYAATRPDEAGEAARFVGGAVANTTTAYAELAAVNAELALLEQQQAVQAKIDRTVQDAQNKIDQTVYDIQATPGRLQDKAAQTAVDTAAAVKAAPGKTADAITNKIKSTLESVQGSAQAQLDAARREIDQRKN